MVFFGPPYNPPDNLTIVINSNGQLTATGVVSAAGVAFNGSLFSPPSGTQAYMYATTGASGQPSFLTFYVADYTHIIANPVLVIFGQANGGHVQFAYLDNNGSQHHGGIMSPVSWGSGIPGNLLFYTPRATTGVDDLTFQIGSSTSNAWVATIHNILDDGVGNFRVTGLPSLGIGSLSATGSTQANAAPIVAASTFVNGGSATQGIVLPVTPLTGTYILVNSDGLSNSVKVYPGLGANIDGGTTNASVPLPANETIGFYYNGPTTSWITFIDAAVGSSSISATHTSGSVTFALALGHSNTWTAAQSFSAITTTAGIASGANTSATTPYTVAATDEVLLITTGASAFSITLPAANANAGRKLIIIKADSGAGAITVSCAGSDTIEGNATATISTQYSKLGIIADGTSVWYDLGIGGV